MEAISGDTPDISVFRFKFYDPVFYLHTVCTTEKKKSWVKGRVIGIARLTGDAMCYVRIIS